MITVTLDTNIYISALEFGGTPLRLLHMAVEEEIETTISQPIIEETRRILRDKFGWSQARLDEVEAWLSSFTRLVAPRQTLDVVKQDPPDNRILECAVEAGSQYVVSGDSDLLRVEQYCGAQIVKLADLLKVMQGKTEPAR